MNIVKQYRPQAQMQARFERKAERKAERKDRVPLEQQDCGVR